ncbi:flavin-dependent oxidoreductase [Nocardia sp. NPDC004860]|uniref:flavin-dependent oxidoreductase n=1 Tax=Nocardia sp. NPDC004860 TaxID=3154557 RepID=UPI0033A4BB41
MKILIAGGGIGGLALALSLQQRNPHLEVHIFEAAPEFKPLGLGINMLPHAIRVLNGLGLTSALASVAVEAQECAFFTHHGQLIHREPCGLFAGYDYPHYSIHRGDLHKVLFDATCERLGADRVHKDHRLVDFTQSADKVTAHFTDRAGRTIGSWTGDLLVGCDGIHSAVRKVLYPNEGKPVFHGINMWRGVTTMQPILTGASAIRIGALQLTGKLVVYPIRNNVDAAGNQLVNWVAEMFSEHEAPCDWSAPGMLDDFLPNFADWKFDWLDCPEMIESAENIVSYPMVDRDPIDRWTFGRVTLVGDAAHPMYPRGGNGGAQAILDAETLAEVVNNHCDDPVRALSEYESMRLATVNNIVLTNRTAPPDSIIELVEQRTSGERFSDISDVITQEEIESIHGNYQKTAGYDRESVAAHERS